MKGTGGIVSQILNNLSKLTKVDETYTRQALHKRIDESDRLKEAYIAEQEHIGDLAETGFFRALQQEEDWAIKEWLKFKGWSRGYTQRVEQNNNVNVFAEIIAKYGNTVEGVIDEVPRPNEITEAAFKDPA